MRINMEQSRLDPERVYKEYWERRLITRFLYLQHVGTDYTQNVVLRLLLDVRFQVIATTQKTDNGPVLYLHAAKYEMPSPLNAAAFTVTTEVANRRQDTWLYLYA